MKHEIGVDMSASNKQLEMLLMAHLGIAKSELSDSQLEKVNPAVIQQYLGLVLELVPIESLVDQILVKHALVCLVEDQTVEETILHIFMLYIYKLCSEGSGHPLEKGIIRQKIISLVPIFEAAFEKKLIRDVYFYPKIEALISIAESDDNKEHIIALLASEYKRLESDLKD